MAGVYPDAPTLHRMAYERDGSAGVRVDTSAGTVGSVPAAELVKMNNEHTDYYYIWDSVGSTQHIGFCLIFPEFRDITSYHTSFYQEGGPAAGTVYTSVDTTNGYDGTWVSRGTWVHGGANVAAQRSPTTVSWLNIKAVRFHTTGGGFTTRVRWQILHLYGGPAAGQNPDRLRLWHPTLNQEITGAHFDYGDAARSTSADKQFRIKNNSATLTANVITVSLDAPTNTTPSVSGQYSLEKASAPGFIASVSIPSLAPGATSEVITMRRVTPVTAVMSLWWARVLASAASWA